MEIEAELSRIIINETVDQQIIVLKEVDGDRAFPVVIGMSEILAIDRRLKGMDFPRPMTHDLLGNIIEAMGGVLDRVVVSDLRNHTFYATLYIETEEEIIEIDARPSDAIALASGLETSIYIDSQVFEKLGM